MRSEKYSLGASINIRWADGPRQKIVRQLTRGFQSASFDGMNDLETPQDSWLLPDGTAEVAERPESYGGSIPGYFSDAPSPDAELVYFGSHYVSCQREVTGYEDRYQASLKMIRENCHCDGAPPNDRFGNNWVSHLAMAMASDYDINETLEETFNRIVLRR